MKKVISIAVFIGFLSLIATGMLAFFSGSSGRAMVMSASLNYPYYMAY